MTGNTIKKCPQCGADLSKSAPNAPCSACLMQLGMQSWAAQNGTFGDWQTQAMENSEAPDLAEHLAEAFPQLEVLHLIGQGGMGAVYCARQKSLNRLVALKVIKPDVNKRQDFERRFQREAQALAQLNHPNIITVHDFGQNGEFYYFIMEFVDGINLRQMIRGEKRLTPAQALQIVPAVCSALQYAHDKGIVHRDIKPENILIDTDGSVKIADFGLAKLLEKGTIVPTLTQANQVMGTMHYMAPEQFERPMDVDHRADIYSLGVVIYELLTGELPLGRFAPPSKKVTIDVRLDEIVLQTLEKEPAHRYQRVSEVASDMQSVSTDRSYVVASRNEQAAAYGASAYANAAPPVKTRTHFSGPAPVNMGRGPLAGEGFWGALISMQTPKNWLFNLLSFPLGVLYFVLVVVGLSVGIGTVIVWIGLFILLGTFLAIRGLTAMDRTLVSGLLNTQVPMRFQPRRKGKNVLESARLLAFNRETWLGVLYLLGKLPLGIISLVSFVISFVVPLSVFSIPILMVIFPDENFFQFNGRRPDDIVEIVIPFLILAVIMVPAVHASNFAAVLQAKWARLCLRR